MVERTASGEERSASPSQEQLLARAEGLQQEVETLQADLEDAVFAFERLSMTTSAQDEMLAQLRVAVADAEEALVRANEDADRDVKDAQREIVRLSEQVLDVQTQIISQGASLQAAVMDTELEKSKSMDVRSRLEAYLVEIDRLKLIEAGLRKQLDDAHRSSSSDSMKQFELGKRIGELEKDKDLLNVALDSKQTELVLLQRSSRPSTATPRGQRMMGLTASTSKLRQATTPEYATPVPSHQLASSASSSSLRSSHARRESSVFAVPATPRQNVAVLGASTKDNKTPDRTPRSKVKTVPTISASVGAKPELTRRSSLPVLVGRGTAPLAKSVGGRVERLVEEEAGILV